MSRKNNRGRNPFQAHEYPEEFGESFSDFNKQQCREIIDFLNATENSLSWLAKLARVDSSTNYRCIKGQYKTDPTPHLKKALDAIHTHQQRHIMRDIPFVKTSVSEVAWAACNRARRSRSFAVLTGYVGTGKTRSLMEYKAAHSNTILIESDPGMSVSAMLDDMVKMLGCSIKNSANQQGKFKAILDEITGTDTLLIIDEAETLTPKALHYLRRIRDKAQIGIVLAGTENLKAIIKPEHGEFDQIRSRVNFLPNTIRAIKRDDCDAILADAFADEGEIEDAVSARLWAYCGGSMRMLVENLIPAVRDYGLKKDHELSVDLIDSIADQVLNLPKPE